MEETQEMESVQSFFDEISYDQIQDMMDGILGQQSFSFSEYVGNLIQGKQTGSLEQILHAVFQGLTSNMIQEKKMIIYLLVIAVIGAVFTNFSKLLQGKQVAQTAFFAVYLLFFSVLSASFCQVTQLAAETMEKLLDFMRVLVPAFFISMSFSQGGTAASVYYEFTLVMITVVNTVLVKFALPAINLYFFLQVSNYLAEEDMFSKMAELIRDVVKMVMKTMFGIVMGMNVIQGLIVPVTAQVKNMTVVRMGGSIPGIGNTISSVAQTVLCAGTLVKNAVGVTGVLVVFLICAVPLLHMVFSQMLYQLVAAIIQPVSDKRLVSSLGGTVEAIRMLIYAVGMGAMLFVTSIAIISAMTSAAL